MRLGLGGAPREKESEGAEAQTEKSPATTKRGVGEVSESSQPRELRAKKDEGAATAKSAKIVSLSPELDPEPDGAGARGAGAA